MKITNVSQGLKKGSLYVLLLAALVYSGLSLRTSSVLAQEDCSGGDPGFCLTGWNLIGTQTEYFGDCHTDSTNYDCGCSPYHSTCVTYSNCTPAPDYECTAH